MYKQATRNVSCLITASKTRNYSQIIPLNHASANTNTNTSVAEALNELPEISGSGPFPDTPKFKVLGSPPTLLQISLPASSELRMRKGTIVAINGVTSPESLSTTLSVDGKLTDLAKYIPMTFQKVVSTTPTSLLVSSTSTIQNPITVVNIEPETPWVVCQRQSVLGWSSSSIQLNSNGSKFKNWGELKATGKGQLALMGQGELFKVELEPGEQVLLNPTNVIAYKSSVKGKNDGVLLKIPRTQTVYNFELPRLLPGKIGEIYSDFTKKLTGNIVIKKLSLWTKRVFGQDNVMFQVVGPKTLLLHTKSEKVSNFFTREELNRILTLRERI